VAEKDADLGFPQAAETFSCGLDMAVSAEATPHLNMLLRRVRADASRANDKAKDYFKRRRPVAVYSDTNCAPRESGRL
jgi:acid phosphatase (class A)